MRESRASAYAAIDLGASSGRVLTGRLDGERLTLTEHHRFPNRPVRLPSGLHWNLLALLAESVGCLRELGSLAGVGVDAWGVDYALLDDRKQVLGLPFHYRDERTRDMVDKAFARVPRAEQYAITGIQTMPINTIFQLMADEGTAALEAARHVALVPDLLAFWLCGELANESTAASTTGLLDARSGEWAFGLIERLGLPCAAFGALCDPGTPLGSVLDHHGLGRVPVFAVAGHDTASAFAAAPLADDGHGAVLSSGTWSLLGLELPAPVLNDAARDANLTNERGVDGTTRLLKNVMGLWLEQECARAWNLDFEVLHAAAAEVTADVPLFDPDADALLAPDDMPARIAETCRAAGQQPPDGVGETVRSILLSLSCKYRWVLERLESVADREIRRIHVVGGGARNELLCQLTADMTGRAVCAGPVEATALGNVLVQARAAGAIGSTAEMRAVVAASTNVRRHEPAMDRDAAQETYRRFLDVTGLAAPISAA